MKEASHRKPLIKSDATYMKCQEWTHLERQKIDW